MEVLHQEEATSKWYPQKGKLLNDNSETGQIQMSLARKNLIQISLDEAI